VADQIVAAACFVRGFACFAGVGVPKSRVFCFRPDVVTHRYEKHIAGRTYMIEVQAISQSRWRAQIARLPGMPTSMMPFYGTTPEEAAAQLSRWLALVYNGTTKQ
jgi:hypothetical protein